MYRGQLMKIIVRELWIANQKEEAELKDLNLDG
jgi:hypothetical protein